MDHKYWIDFWKEYTTNILHKDQHSQVLRTFNKKPISERLWDFTLSKIDEVFTVKKDETVLDLCSGNGLLAKHFLNKGASVVAVDVSEELLVNISNIKGIKTINSDVLQIDFEENSFDKIILYAGNQYFNYKESVVLLKNIQKWLTPGGIAFVGDIPDLKRRWTFFNTDERRRIYFDNLLDDKAIVGTWFEKEWFDYVTNYIGFKKGKFLEQDPKLIYAKFRFDYLFEK